MDVPIRVFYSLLLRQQDGWKNIDAKNIIRKHWSSNEFRTGCRSAHHFHYNSIHLGAYANNHFQSSFEVTPFFSLVPGACFPIIGHLHVGVISLLRPQSFSFFLSYLKWESHRALNHKSPNLNKKANPLRILSSAHSSKMTLSFKWPIFIGSEKLLSFTFKIELSIGLQII